MAGQDPAGIFVGAEFRVGLRNPMLMGIEGPTLPAALRTRLLAGEAIPLTDLADPSIAANWPTFHYADPRTYPSADSTGAPWSWAATATGAPVPTPKVALCGIQELGVTIQSTRGVGTSLGTLESDRVILVLFDEEYTALGDWVTAELGENVLYDRGKELRPVGMWEVGVHRIECGARDVGGIG